MDKDREKDKEFDQIREENRAEGEETRNLNDDETGNESAGQLSAEETGSADTSKAAMSTSGQENPDWTRELEGTFNVDQDGDPHGPKSRKPLSKGKKILLATAGTLLIMLAAAGTYAMTFYSDVQEAERILLEDQVFEEEYGTDVDAAFSERKLNIALLGFDRGWNREAYGEYLFRPDMMAVFSIDFDKDQVSVVRIPRDSYVPIYGTGGYYDKINHAYFSGYYSAQGEERHKEGVRTTLQTISNVLGGIPLHYYVSVDMYSVIELVDAMGGIYYEVEEEIIDKHWEIGRVLVPEGPQIMDGKTFLRYLQYRDDKTGQDYGRMDRQMNLLRETFIYLRQEGKITDIPATYRIYKDYVETDLSYTQIAALAYYALDLDISDLDETLGFYTVQGGGQMKDGIWYQVIHDSSRREIIKEVFGVKAESWPPIVLEDSPEYIEEQRLKELEERRGNGDRKEKDEDKEEEKEEPGAGAVDNENGLAEDQEDSDEADFDTRKRVTVPELEGKTVPEAERLLKELGLKVGDIKSRSYDYLDQGLIIFSVPMANSVTWADSEINLVVSDGPRNDWN